MWIALGAVAVVLAFLAITGAPRLAGIDTSIGAGPGAGTDSGTDSGIDTDSSAGTGATDPSAEVPARPDDAFALTVEYVIDGDTITATIDEPNDVIDTSERVSVRIIGIDTAEMRPSPECWAQEATDHLNGMLPEGATVWATADREAYDRYDRALLYLWTDAGVFINHEMIAIGDAEALEVAPNTTYADLFAHAEAEARANSLGRWEACPPAGG